jgi:glycosyltransferase involved in cell wall biosynthesis
LQPEFPEVSANGEWESREYIFRNGIRNATMLLSESETGKEDILNFYGEYGVTADQVKVLPLLPSITLQREINAAERQRVRQKYSLPDRYFFYPAQFWPHKNHLRIVQAMALLKEQHDLRVHILFSGYHSGDIREATFKEVADTATKLQVQDQISYFGYVPDDDIAALYAEARGLIMPTFFGATNIPPLEAWALGCPVLTSDIRGIRQQAGEASVLVDPKSVEAIAGGMQRLWTDDELCKTLIAQGAQRLNKFTFDDFRKRLSDVIQEAKSILGAA